MPNALVNKYSKETGKSRSEVEKALKLAQKDAEDMGQEDNWAYIHDIWQSRLGLSESESLEIISSYLTEKFIESDKSTWDEFIETMTSGDFTITPENLVDTTQNKDREEELEESTMFTDDYIGQALIRSGWKKKKESYEKLFKLGSTGENLNPSGMITVQITVEDGRWVVVQIGWYSKDYDGREFGIELSDGMNKVKQIEKDIKNYQLPSSGFRNNLKESRDPEDFIKGRIILPNEKFVSKDGHTLRPGDLANHYKFGKIQILSVNIKTYSIVMVTFTPTEGKLQNEIIVRPSNEISKY